MGSIFSKPPSEPEPDYRIIYLHGLEGSPAGFKSSYLKKKWQAKCPQMRVDKVRTLRSKYGRHDVPSRKLNKAIIEPFEDVRSSVKYYKPDVVIGSSFGGALLLKMILEGEIDPSKTGCIFLAPAIGEILGKNISEEQIPKAENSVWILGEADTVVNNRFNVGICKKMSGNIIYSAGDCHRLHSSIKSGLVDSAIATVLELGCQ